MAFGAFFPSIIKPNAEVADIELLQQARAELTVPLVAIGGINLHNAASLVHAGADALAVISALFGSEDIMATAKKLSKLFNSNRLLYWKAYSLARTISDAQKKRICVLGDSYAFFGRVRLQQK